MSIDMQFSLLSSDLDAAPSSSARARGSDADKDFAEAFDEQLQQANDAESTKASANNQRPAGQEVATSQKAQSEVAATATVDKASTDVLSTEQASELQPINLLSNTEEGTGKSGNMEAGLEAERAASLFQLITRSRDYAAELGAGAKGTTAQNNAQTAADLAKAGSADEAALLLAQLQQAKKPGAEQSTEQTKTAAEALIDEDSQDQTISATQQALLQQKVAAADQTTGGSSLAEQGAAQQTASEQKVVEQGTTLQNTRAQVGQFALTATDDLSVQPKQSTEADTLKLQSELQAGTAAKAAESAAADAGKTTQDGSQNAISRAEKFYAEQGMPEQNEQKVIELSRLESETTTGQVQPQQAKTAEQNAAGAVSNSQNAMAGQSLATENTGTDSPQLTEQTQLTAALLGQTPAAVAGKDKNKTQTATFAEFQKSANAALVQQQKQQQQNEAQYSTAAGKAGADAAIAETMTAAIQVPQQEGAAVPVLAATDKSLATTSAFNQAGSQSGSQSGSQQHSSFSQILATKQADPQIQSQPALSLLEPNAATQLKERVMYQVNQKIQSADIRLTPEDLGTVQIKINLQQEQLSVQFVVQQSAAKEALEQQMPRLKELLQEQGMALTDGQVHQQQSEQHQQQDERRTAGRANTRDAAVGDDEAVVQQVQVAVSDRMVDYYA
ncbi:flagellar hook-length control protein FliK [Rheinheimera sp.]|uniref:flagellar hook-length control protein FliK n=1 Tax=Rheinheimera sp. TaxID=1869214 RepID=UPI002FDEF466